MKVKYGLVVLLLVLGLVLVLSGCENLFGSDDEDDKKTESLTAVTGPYGGVISLDNDFELEIPEGVLDESSDVTIKRVSSSYFNVETADHHEPIGDIIAVEMEQSLFENALLLKFQYPTGIEPENLVVGHFSDGEYTTHEAYIDIDEELVVFPTHSLSGFGLFTDNSGKYVRPQSPVPLNEIIDFSEENDFLVSYDANNGVWFNDRDHWGPVDYPGRDTVLFCAAMKDGELVSDATTYEPKMDSSLVFYYENNTRDIENFVIEFDTFVQRDPNSQTSNQSGYLTKDLMTFEISSDGWNWRSWGPNGKAAPYSVYAWTDTSSWVTQQIDLSDYSTRLTRIAGTSVWGNSEYPKIWFRFRFRSNNKSVSDGYGAYIDNLQIIVEESTPNPEPSLTISPTSGSHDAESDSGSISVSSNGSWSASANRSWISITSGSSGSGDGTVRYSVSENSSSSSRSGTITVSGGDISRSFSVSQEGASDEPDDAGGGSFSVSYSQVGSFTDEPGVKAVDYFGGSQAFGFGRSTCSSSCFSNYASTLTIDLGEERYISTLSFEQIEAYGNWGSSGSVTLDGETVSGVRLGGEPSNSFAADREPRTSEVSIGQSVRQIEFYVSDITNQSEILIADIRIDGDLVHLTDVDAGDSEDDSEPTGSYSIGDTGPAGGVVFYDKGSFSDGWRYLEAAPSDIDVSGDNLHPWGGYGTEVGGTGTAIGTGADNTATIVEAYGASDPYGNTGNYAARLADRYEYGGYDDWFLPSKDELDEMEQNFLEIREFLTLVYWSSSEYNSDFAYGQVFVSGFQVDVYKTNGLRVRAVRAF